jgi:hypothetical protein
LVEKWGFWKVAAAAEPVNPPVPGERDQCCGMPRPTPSSPSRECPDKRGWTDIGDNQVANESDAENEEGAGEKHVQHEDGIRTGIVEKRSTIASGHDTAITLGRLKLPLSPT